MPDSNQITLHDLGTDEYDEILLLWERAGLPVRPQGRDAPDRFARRMADRRQRVVGLRANAKLIAAPVVTTAQFVVASKRWRQTFAR